MLTPALVSKNTYSRNNEHLYLLALVVASLCCKGKGKKSVIKFQFYLGTDTRGRMTEQAAIKLAYDLAARHFPSGHSIREEEGRWTGQQGPVDEVTVVVTWLAEADHSMHDHQASCFAKAYKDAAYQEAVLIEKQTVEAFTV